MWAGERRAPAADRTITCAAEIYLLCLYGRVEWVAAKQDGRRNGGLSRAIEQLRHERNILYSTLLCQEPLIIAGVQQVLDALHGTYVMGIVTSSEQDHFALIHQTTGLLPYFRFVLTAGDYTHSKPHPEPYLLAVERSGCRKEECLVIEDSERGLTAARKLDSGASWCRGMSKFL
jgi:HAD superfamily hydrolase (TIGR01509 family)